LTVIRHLLSRLRHRQIPALLLAFGVCVPIPAAAQDAVSPVDWKAEAVDRGEAAVALSGLYATLYNSGQIVTRQVEVGKGDTPAGIMRREGSWPAYLGPANRMLDAVVCNLNPSVCQRERIPATGAMLSDISQNVAATVPTDGDWRGLRSGAMLTIPDYSIEQIYETISTSEGYLAKRYYDQDIRILRTGALADLYCNQQPAACPDRPAVTWESEAAPPILQFDPTLYDPARDGDWVPKEVVAAFLDPDARSILVAVPHMRLRQNLSLPRVSNPARIGLDEIQQRQDGRMLVVPELRTESTEGLQDWNRALLDRMQLLSSVQTEPEETSDRIVTIYHFDKGANLQHCLFGNLKGVELLEWRDAENGRTAGPVPVSLAGAADCALVEGAAIRSKDHGTHTLGLLVAQLEAYARALPPDVTYFRVVHVPLSASEFESGTAPEASGRIRPVLELLIPPNEPDVVSMSLSWPATGMDALNQLVLAKEELITFVVAAPRLEGPNECARGPAGIKWPSGSFAENVISVVGLTLSGSPEAPEVGTVADAGTGSKCHEIGAFGTLFGPIGDSNAVDEMTGASQATPVVAATVAELIRRLPTDSPRPDSIADHLIASAWFDPDLINMAKGTLLDSGNLLITADTDLIITNSGCQVLGDYVQIKDSAGANGEFFFKIGADTRRVPSRRKLLSFRNLDGNKVLVVSVNDDPVGVNVEVGERQSGMNNRTIQFSPTHLSQDQCDGITLGSDTIPVSVVDQLIVSKLGG
jgi:Subtilase family